MGSLLPRDHPVYTTVHTTQLHEVLHTCTCICKGSDIRRYVPVHVNSHSISDDVRQTIKPVIEPYRGRSSNNAVPNYTMAGASSDECVCYQVASSDEIPPCQRRGVSSLPLPVQINCQLNFPCMATMSCLMNKESLCQRQHTGPETEYSCICSRTPLDPPPSPPPQYRVRHTYVPACLMVHVATMATPAGFVTSSS